MLKQSQCECPKPEQVRYLHRLTVQSPIENPDASGHTDLTNGANWKMEDNIKANFKSRGGREFINAEQVNAEVTHILETPSTAFSRRIRPEWRLLFGDRTFQITAAYDVDEQRRIVRIHVAENP